MSRALAIALVCSAAVPVAAGAQTIRGTAIEDGSLRPIAAALVTLLTEEHELIARTVTDSAGRFTVSAEETGRYKLRVQSIAHVDATSAPFHLDVGTMLQVRFVLSPDVLLLAPLEITARSRPLITGMFMQDYEERRAQGLGFAITREDIEVRHARAVSDLLRMVPGVRVEWRFGGSAIYIPGTGARIQGECPVRVLLDGVDFRWGNTTIDDIPTYDIEAIEVFRNLAEMPAELAGPESRCGVVAVWTRRGRN